ncbi:MAG: leucine-rich repeat protein, partial [Clostridiales bacterium]|nr:leucine-rich repeat protein [Clostridiales bacterium]
MKKRVLALLLAGAFVMQSSAALAAEIDVSEDVIEEDIVLTEDTEEDSGLVVDETAPESEDATVEDDVQSITVQDVPTSGTCGTKLTWSFAVADGTLTISGEGAMDDYDSWSSRPWNDLGESITTVVVEDGVTTIGKNAFFALVQLKTAELGKDVTRIGARAFGNCNNLESINIPDGVTAIEGGAFANCSKLKELVLPDGVTRIGEAAFAECLNLESINIPDRVTAIEGGAFAYCIRLKELVLPESVESLGGSSLENIHKLTLTVRNPKCVFNNPNMRSGTIRGHAGSTAQVYADRNPNITFEAIDTWDNGTVTTAPTCTEKGVKTYHCTNSDCTATKTEKIEIDPDNHTWSAWEVTTPATCTEDGVETRTCKNDKTHTETRTIEATNHDWGEWKVTTPATCTEDGVETRTCKNDKTHTETRKIPATGAHTYATTITKAKPGKDGSIVKKCTVCGKVESKTAISAPQKIVLSKTAYTYSGKAKNPTITVKDAAGKTISSSNYTVSYATTRTSIGTHKVTVTFKGSKYEGSLSAKFVINPKAPSIKSASNLVKGIKVTWKPVSGITGYQIQLSTNKSFKNSKIISASKTATSKKITG